MRQTLLSEDTAGSTRAASQPRPLLPLRSHNSLLYNLPSTCPRPPQRERGNSMLLAALSDPLIAVFCPPISRVPGRGAWSRCLVEVIGLEPTTPCLQSRCSPS